MVNGASSLSTILERFSGDDRRLIQRAYDFAAEAHADQKRSSGEPYITHPLAVATHLSEIGFDAPSIVAALLHDTIEDCGVTYEEVEKKFNPEVAFLVDSVTKLKTIRLAVASGAVKDQRMSDLKTESLKKMFFAMAKDVRVIIIKLADRLHNMRTLEYQNPEKRVRKAHETLEIYAPIADRLGMGRLKGDLEDLAFPWAYPQEHSWLRKTVRGKYTDRLRYIERTAPLVKHYLLKANIPVLDIHSRAKRLWSLFRKLKRYGMNPDNIMDLVAMRIIVPGVKECYEALGIIHAHYRPVPGRIKDYIALPKPNGYRSLHTSVFCEKGRIAEIQIRTPEMHDHAENGVAAHWNYKEAQQKPKLQKKGVRQELAWINQLKTTLRGIKTSTRMADLKIDFFKNRIFALTPHGDVKDLPEGATPVDFAYAVHSELGHHVQGAMVNEQIASLDQPLQSGDVVRIIRGREARPRQDWLRFIKTTHAAKQIRTWLKKNNPAMAITDGRLIFNRELAKLDLSVDKLNRQHIALLLRTTSCRTFDSLLTHISMGDIDPGVTAQILAPHAPTEKVRSTRKKQPTTPRPLMPTVILAQQPGLAYRIGRCCSPTIDSPIVGYLTMSRGVTVHHQNCPNIRTADERRMLDARWEEV